MFLTSFYNQKCIIHTDLRLFGCPLSLPMRSTSLAKLWSLSMYWLTFSSIHSSTVSGKQTPIISSLNFSIKPSHKFSSLTRTELLSDIKRWGFIYSTQISKLMVHKSTRTSQLLSFKSSNQDCMYCRKISSYFQILSIPEMITQSAFLEHTLKNGFQMPLPIHPNYLLALFCQMSTLLFPLDRKH